MHQTVTPQQLMDTAKNASVQSYAPYSQFPVGAAILMESGEILTGCNVENVSFGLTICAEQTAVVKAVSEGHKKFKAIAVWAKNKPYGSITPCGACRQILSEFLPADAPVYRYDDAGKIVSETMSTMLPFAFEEI